MAINKKMNLFCSKGRVRVSNFFWVKTWSNIFIAPEKLVLAVMDLYLLRVSR